MPHIVREGKVAGHTREQMEPESSPTITSTTTHNSPSPSPPRTSEIEPLQFGAVGDQRAECVLVDVGAGAGRQGGDVGQELEKLLRMHQVTAGDVQVTQLTTSRGWGGGSTEGSSVNTPVTG